MNRITFITELITSIISDADEVGPAVAPAAYVALDIARMLSEGGFLLDPLAEVKDPDKLGTALLAVAAGGTPVEGLQSSSETPPTGAVEGRPAPVRHLLSETVPGCPFCGSSPFIFTDPIKGNPEMWNATIGCGNTACIFRPKGTTPKVPTPEQAKEMAISLWRKRQ